MSRHHAGLPWHSAAAAIMMGCETRSRCGSRCCHGRMRTGSGTKGTRHYDWAMLEVTSDDTPDEEDAT